MSGFCSNNIGIVIIIDDGFGCGGRNLAWHGIRGRRWRIILFISFFFPPSCGGGDGGYAHGRLEHPTRPRRWLRLLWRGQNYIWPSRGILHRLILQFVELSPTPLTLLLTTSKLLFLPEKTALGCYTNFEHRPPSP